MKNIYLCGPTVYSEVHIGNMRPILTFDIFNRSLKYLGEDINFIHNITDIDDKIIDKALSLSISEAEVSKKYTDLYLELIEKYNIVKPNKMPLVTESINGLIEFIKELVEKEAAYVVDGNVYFSVEKQSTYGSLSNRTIETMKFEDKGIKRHPGDFAVWKNTKVGIAYDSPWGKGRPGWHTECSYFVNEYLKGESLDIHGGGIDLLFPHHENEDAQYIAINNKTISKEWRHVGHVMFDNEKMSKSLGNVFNAKEFADKYGTNTLRYMFLTSSYSSPMNVNEQTISQAVEAVEKLEKVFKKSNSLKSDSNGSGLIKEIAISISKWNFSSAVKTMHKVVKNFNTENTKEAANDVVGALELLGFSFKNNDVSQENKDLITKWEALKADKNYEEADKIRAILLKNKLI